MMGLGRTIAMAGSLAGATLVAVPASAQSITWETLDSQSTDASGLTTVKGTILVNGTSVGVTFTGSGLAFVQTNNTGTNYWADYNGAPNAFVKDGTDYTPGTSDIIALSAGGLKSITFSQAVSNVYLALVSWNGNVGTFDQPFTVFSQGCGYWGCGSFTNVTPNSFIASGELHGIMSFDGTFSTVTFNDVSENWHGILIGIAGLAAPAVPEPATWTMMIAGLGLAGGALRRRTGDAKAALA